MKILMAVFSVLLLLPALPTVVAQADNSSATASQEDGKAGILPDSPFYFFDKALARISLALTFDKVAKAEKSLKIANERLLEVKEMALKGKFEHAARAQREYARAVEQAEKAADKIESHGTSEEATEALQKIAALQNKTESHAQKVSEIKEAIIERQGERMSPEQLAKLEQVFWQVKEKAAEMELKLASKREKVKIKHRVLANITPEQSKKVEEGIDEKAGLTKGREERAKGEIKKVQEESPKAEEELKEPEEKDGSATRAKELAEKAAREIKKETVAKEKKKSKETEKETKDESDPVTDAVTDASSDEVAGSSAGTDAGVGAELPEQKTTGLPSQVITKLP